MVSNEPIQVAESLADNKFSIKVLYGSVTGKSKVIIKLIIRKKIKFLRFLNNKHFAEEFVKSCLQNGYSDCMIVNLKNYDPEDSLLNEVILLDFV